MEREAIHEVWRRKVGCAARGDNACATSQVDAEDLREERKMAHGKVVTTVMTASYSSKSGAGVIAL
jgi:hypothetical protein